MSAPLSRKRSATRARIVEGARRVFHRDGFRRVTIDDVCSQIGLTRKTFYQYFGAKEELVDAVIEDNLQAITRGVDDAVRDTGDDPYARLVRLQQYIAANLLWRVSPALVRDIQTLRPDLWARLDAQRRILFSRLEQVFADGQRRSVLRPDINPKLVTLMLVAAMGEVLCAETLADRGLSVEEAFRDVFDVFLHGLVVRPAPPRSRKREGRGATAGRLSSGGRARPRSA